jgi:hypothetical protein
VVENVDSKNIENKVIVPAPQNVDPLINKPENKSSSGPFHMRMKFLVKLFIFIILIVLVVLALGVIIAVKPAKQIGKIQSARQCSQECKDSGNPNCMNNCFEKKGLVDLVTPAKITSTPTPTPTVSPTPTLALKSTPTIAKKVSSVPKSTPTPAGPPTLVIRTDKNLTLSVTLLNQTTSKTISDSVSYPGKIFYVDPGDYRITFNNDPECFSSYSLCYERCGIDVGDWGYNQDGNTANIKVESGKTHGVSIGYADPGNHNNICSKYLTN